MIVRLTETEPARLVEPGNVKALSVELVGDAPLDLGTFGSVDGDGQHAWLGVKALREAAHEAGVPESWDDDFAKMLEYAETKGWLSTSGTAVRAHIEQR
jgi:hypothetical protein